MVVSNLNGRKEIRKMNLVQFLKKVDDTMSRMSNEQMKSCIREFARTLPENKRQYFLETMNAVQQSESASAIRFEKYGDDISSEIKAIKDALTNINDGNCCLGSELNEEWDDWYNSYVDEYLFSDP